MRRRSGRPVRGEGYFYEQAKTRQIIVLLTPAAALLLDERVRDYRDGEGRSLSRSEYFERWARGLL
jgi:hypothetical protein